MTIAHVVLDRDGVLNIEDEAGGWVLTPQAFVWIPGALEAVRRLIAAGVHVSVATNQRCVAVGALSESELAAIHDKLRQDSGICAVYHCPHHSDAGCRCRKPGPQLLERAIHDSGVPLASTVFIGDAATDMQAATAAGIAGWLVRTGKGRDAEASPTPRVPVFADLSAAVDAVLERT